MSYSRRHFIQTGAALAAAGALPSPLQRPLFATGRKHIDRLTPIEDPVLKPLTDASLEAARAAGASYADARLTHTYTLGGFANEDESMTFGVRVLVDGYWGFAASPFWTIDEAARLGRAAVRQAKANAIGKQRVADLAPVPGTADTQSGHWTTPIVDDPFAISIDEINDFLAAIRYFLEQIPGVSPQTVAAKFMKQDKAFASTSGQYLTQRLYQTSGAISFFVDGNGRRMSTSLDTLSPAGAGFEYLRDQPLREQIMKEVEEARADLRLPNMPLDVGRYETVLDANTVASILSETVGAATELDRALGYEANAGGTSYITEPLEMIGTMKIGSPVVTISGNRSEATGAATVKWDDEGVAPDEFTLVKNGILSDMQTDREGAGVLRDIYTKQGKPLASHGCAYAPDAIFAPLTHCANLQLQAGPDVATFESLIERLQKGVAFKRASTDMDFQQITGLTTGLAYEVRNGKRTAILNSAGIVFRTPEFWSAITAIGGAGSRKRLGLEVSKGQPSRSSAHSVTACPVVLKELTIIDISRKA